MKEGFLKMKQSPVARIFGLVCDWYYLKGTMWRTFWFGRTIGLGKLGVVMSYFWFGV